MRKKLQRPEAVVCIVVVIIGAIIFIAAISVPPWPPGKPTREEATVWITALTGCGTIAAVAVAAWAAWQSQRAADGTQRTADLMNKQWDAQRRERHQEQFQRLFSALRAVRMEASSTADLCKSGSILLVHSFGTWVYCREEIARAFPDTAASIDGLNQNLLAIERRVDALSNHSLQPWQPTTGGVQSSPPIGGMSSIIGHAQSLGPQLDDAVRVLDAHTAIIEQENRHDENGRDVIVK